MHAYALFYLLFHQNKNNDKNIICFDWELPMKVIRVFYGWTQLFFLLLCFWGCCKKKVSVLSMGNAERMQWQMRLLVHFLFFHLNVKLVFQRGR